MKTMKRFAARICALFVVLTVSLTALVPAAFAATKAQLPDLPSSQCVVDDANILSSSTKTAIENLNAQLTQQCEGAQIGVLTVDYTGSLSTEDYAVQAANTWGLGSSSKNNGVLILLVMQSQQYADGDYYLATGDGFRNTTLEKQASAIAQTMEDSFAAGDYDAAVTTCANNVASTIADLYGVTPSEETEPGGGWNYTDIVDFLSGYPDATGADLGEMQCQSYYQHCIDNGDPDGVTFAITDLSKINGLLTAFDATAKEMRRWTARRARSRS